MAEVETKWRPPSVMLIFLISCGVFFFMVNILQLDNYIIHPNERYVDVYIPDIEESMRGYLVKTPGCRIPAMDPFDDSIVEYVHKEEKIVCDSKPPLVDYNDTSIFMIESSIDAYNLDNTSEVSCCYKSFWRVEPKNNWADVSSAKFSSCLPFNNSADITSEFIEVTCKQNNAVIYKDFFSFVPPRKSSEPQWTKLPLNVLFVGIDALSRLNFIRQMPKTVEFLRGIGSFEFKGFNKVGDNTFPNLIPVLTGMSVEELTENCWKNNSYFDYCNFIWKDFEKRGFTTSFAEDCSWMGTFYYLKEGFLKQPTDYYWTFFNMVAGKKISNTKRMNVRLCYGGRLQYKIFLDYLKTFVNQLHLYQKTYFGFFWSNSISHDFLNTPQLADEDYYNVLSNFYHEGKLNRTILVVMSDHGIRWGGIRSTYQGMMEERLPVLMIRFPEWYKAKYPKLMENMVQNTRQLVTQFDVYETLKDMMDPFNISYHEGNTTTVTKRGYSLFEKIPLNRSCDDAGIVSHWCTCQSSTPLNVNNSMVLNIALYAVDYINLRLEGFPNCANLTLDKIFSARLQKHENIVQVGGVRIEDYTVNLRTKPGGALFEVTVRNFFTKDGSLRFEIMGSISRINLYADQSRCISDFRMKLYCFCKEFLD